jgi:hypothetical protein
VEKRVMGGEVLYDVLIEGELGLDLEGWVALGRYIKRVSLE